MAEMDMSRISVAMSMISCKVARKGDERPVLSSRVGESAASWAGYGDLEREVDREEGLEDVDLRADVAGWADRWSCVRDRRRGTGKLETSFGRRDSLRFTGLQAIETDGLREDGLDTPYHRHQPD